MENSPQTHDAIRRFIPGTVFACIGTLVLGAALPTLAWAQPGDMNCDGVVNTADVPLFVEALLGTTGFGGCDIGRADMNADTSINALDTQGFVAALVAPACDGHFLWCDGGCVDPWINTAHCGGCGISCAGGQNCVGGICQPAEPCPGC